MIHKFSNNSFFCQEIHFHGIVQGHMWLWGLRQCVAKDICLRRTDMMSKIFMSGWPIWRGRDTSKPASWLRPSYLSHMSPTKGRFSFRRCWWYCWAVWTLWWNVASKLNLLICSWLLRLAGQILIVLPLSKVQHKCISCLTGAHFIIVGRFLQTGR